MATIVKFYKDGKKVKDITSVGYLPVDEEAVKDSRHLASSGSVIAAAALGEESMMANLPIEDNTLRFSFGDLDYDPTVAGVGSSGTWTKKNTKFTNIWDWTNTNESWATAFGGSSGVPGAFADYENNPVKVVAAGDTSQVTDFSRFFAWCTAITEICPIDTSNATNVRLMFNHCENCEKFPNMDFSGAVDDTAYVYQCCYKMKVGPNIEFPTEHAFSLQGFFLGCKNLEMVPLYNTSECNKMTSMFQQENAESYMSLRSIPLFDTSNVTNMVNMFNGCKLVEVPLFDTSNVTNMATMFTGCDLLESVPLFNTSNVTNMNNIFYGCRALRAIPSFDYSKVVSFSRFAADCIGITEIPEMNIEAAVTTCGNMFENCPNVKSGQKALYDTLSAIGTITNHTDCFKDCGRDTEEGRAALAQIPVSWGGTMAEEP